MTHVTARCGAPVGVPIATCTGERIRLAFAALRAHGVSCIASDVSCKDAIGAQFPIADRKQAEQLDGTESKKCKRTVYMSQSREVCLVSCGICPGSWDITARMECEAASSVRACESFAANTG
jgi:hypothetical protein